MIIRLRRCLAAPPCPLPSRIPNRRKADWKQDRRESAFPKKSHDRSELQARARAGNPSGERTEGGGKSGARPGAGGADSWISSGEGARDADPAALRGGYSG